MVILNASHALSLILATQCIQRGPHQPREQASSKEPHALTGTDKAGPEGPRVRRSLPLAQALVLRRLAGDSPEASLADEYECLSIYRAFGQSIGEHRKGVEPVESVDPPCFEILAHGQRV